MSMFCGAWYPIMQYACAILPFVARLGVLYFPTLSHKRYDFRKKIIERKILIFSTTFV